MNTPEPDLALTIACLLLKIHTRGNNLQVLDGRAPALCFGSAAQGVPLRDQPFRRHLSQPVGIFFSEFSGGFGPAYLRHGLLVRGNGCMTFGGACLFLSRDFRA